jgi:hypothetical protein
LYTRRQTTARSFSSKIDQLHRKYIPR